MAAAAAVTAPRALAGPVGNANGVLVPPAKRGIILYTVRDAISARPADVALASGFKEVLRGARDDRLPADRVRRVPPARQRPGRATSTTVAGAALLRTWLDDNGLEAEGNHGSIPGTITDATIAAFDAACEIANILGMGHIGTGSDPTSSAFVADWEARRRALELLRRAGRRRHGLKLYTHNHDIAYSFLLDSGPLDALGRPTRSQRHPPPRVLPGQHRPEATSTSRWTSTGRTSRSTSTTPTPRPTARRWRTIFDPAGLGRRADHAVPAVPRQGRRDGHQPGQRLRHDAVRPGRHRLLDVPPPGRRQGLAQPDVGAGHRARRHRRTRAVAGVREDQLRRRWPALRG